MKKAIILSIAVVLVMTGCSLTQKTAKEVIIGPEEAKAKVVDFINKNLMQPDNGVTAKEITEENNLYKVVVSTKDNQDITTYVTLDGTKFFPQVMDMAEIEKQAQQNQAQQETAQAQTTANITKQDKPSVELFVMSYCPYGTQIEKGLLPVLATLGDKIDFELKFCAYSMHEKKELDENLRQYCIQKNEGRDKLETYLNCFLDAGDSEKCLGETGINTSQLQSCITATDNEFKVIEGYNDKSTWQGGTYPSFGVNKDDNTKYGVTGSPTLIINGQKISSGRDSATLLKTICAGFNNPPAECSQTLSSETPSPGFGFGTTGSSSSGGCQ